MSVRTHRATPRQLSASPRFYPFFVGVMAVQGVHVVEHVMQLVQVYAFDVPSERAFGVLGYVFNVMGTAEWMHLVFNAAYLLSLYVILLAAHELLARGDISRRVFAAFAVLGAGLETWHMTEHAVIISNVVRNNGCPCPGIGDQALNVSDVQLHFVYNALTYGATVGLFVAVRRWHRPRPVFLRRPGEGYGQPRRQP
jgi:hypothetical protein